MPKRDLFRILLLHAIDRSRSTGPEIAIKRGPETWFDVIAQVTLNRCHRPLCSLGVPRVEVAVRSIQPQSSIPFRYPAPPSPGQTHFRFECPPIRADIDQPRRVILTDWNYGRDANADRPLLRSIRETRSGSSRGLRQGSSKPGYGHRPALSDSPVPLRHLDYLQTNRWHKVPTRPH